MHFLRFSRHGRKQELTGMTRSTDEVRSSVMAANSLVGLGMMAVLSQSKLFVGFVCIWARVAYMASVSG